MDDPKELIGKFLAYDSPDPEDFTVFGMIWAYITDVRALQNNRNPAPKYKLITNNMRIKSGPDVPIREINGCERALDWDTLKDRQMLVFDAKTQKISFPKDLKDSIMLTMLDSKPLSPFGMKAMALGMKDWLHLIEDEELKELLENSFVKRNLEGYAKDNEQDDLRRMSAF